MAKLQRRSKDEILNTMRECIANADTPPGAGRFHSLTGVTEAEVLYYWPTHSALIEEAGGQRNAPKSLIDIDDLFQEY